MTEHFIRCLARPNSFDPEKFTVEVIAVTPTLVARRDALGGFLERLDIATLDPLAPDLPVFDNHLTSSCNSLIGRVVASRHEGGELILTLPMTSHTSSSGSRRAR